MTAQLSTTVRTTQAQDVADALGADFDIEIRSGAPPANCAAADSGTLLTTFDTVNFAAAASGAVALSGTPYTSTASGGSATAPGHFRMKTSPGGVTILQGTVATSGGDMTVDVASITTGQTVNLSGYTYTRGGA